MKTINLWGFKMKEKELDYLERQDTEKYCENCGIFTDKLFKGLCRRCYEDLMERYFEGRDIDY